VAVANLIMAAAFAAVSGLVSLESIIKAVPEYAPKEIRRTSKQQLRLMNL